MKIFNTEQIREADKYTIDRITKSSIALMEQAAKALLAWFLKNISTEKTICVFCGTGNNGGDGMALARLLVNKNYNCKVFFIGEAEKGSADFRENFDRLQQLTQLLKIESGKDFPEINTNSIIVDALFGTGISRRIEGLYAELIQHLNDSKAHGVSIDLPSGLMADEIPTSKNEVIIKAAVTLTFQFPKLSFMFSESFPFVGEFEVLDIGLSTDYIESTSTNHFFLDHNLVGPLLQSRKKFDHKGVFGHALMISGSYGKMGAAILSTHACLRSGVGLVTAHIPACGYQIMQTALPEAMVETDVEEKFIAPVIKLDKYDAVGIGPGIGTEKPTQNALKVLLQESNVPMVLDADAINILSENKTWISYLPAGSILTPHPKEFERLVGKCDNSYERFIQQKEFSRKYGVYVVLKGAHTSITAQDGNCYFNSSGNPGMATGGSGDVLTGIILSLLAQGYREIDAAIIGVYLHGLAGDFAAEEKGVEYMMASDIINSLEPAFRSLSSID